MSNTVIVSTSTASVVVTEDSGAITTITTPSAPQIITAYTEGPAGGGIGSIGQIPDVDISAVTNGSLLVYDGSVSKFKADSNWTTNTLTDGGNF
jgi:hypothetical protein